MTPNFNNILDQGKMSIKSSHRYQSSNTVGQKSETYVPQAMFSVSPAYEAKPGDCMCEPEVSTGLRRTHSRRERRQRARMRKRLELLSTLPPDHSEDDELRLLNPKLFADRQLGAHNKREKQRKHEAYITFLQQTRSIRPPARKTICYPFFEACYRPDEPFQVTPLMLKDFTKEMERQHCPTINLSQFPNASAELKERCQIPREEVSHPPQLGMPDYDLEGPIVYEPQGGSAVGMCASQLSGAATSCSKALLEEVEEIPAFMNVVIDSVSSYLVQKELCTQSLFLAFLVYFAFRLTRDIMALVSFVVGVTLASNVRNVNKTVYSPQAADLNSDDGALFTGTMSRLKSTKPTSTADKPSPSPGVSISPGARMPQNEVKPPPGFPPRTKNLGCLNGFSAGI